MLKSRILLITCPLYITLLRETVLADIIRICYLSFGKAMLRG